MYIDNISASFVFDPFGENFASLPVGLSTVTAVTTRPNQTISVGVMSESDIVAFDQTAVRTFTLSGILLGLSPEQLTGLVVTYTINDGELQTVLVNADGTYIITGIPEGAMVSAFPPDVAGFTVSPGTSTVNNFQSDIKQQNFLYTRETTFTLSEMLKGLSPEQLTGLMVMYKINNKPTQSVTVNTDGSYLIIGIPKGAMVSVFPPNIAGFTVSPEVRTVNSIQSNITLQDFSYMRVTPFTLSGMLDGLNPEQLAGLMVMYKINNNPTQTVTVNADGSYLITSIPEGAIVFVFPPTVAGFTVSPEVRTVNSIQSDITQQDYLYMRETNTFTLSGTLHGLCSGQLAGLVVMYVINHEPTQAVPVGANGFYLINGIPAGATISVFPPLVGGFMVSPGVRTVNIVQSDITQQDFLYTKSHPICGPCCCACVPCCKCKCNKMNKSV